MASENLDISTAQKLLAVRQALEAGRLHVLPEHAHLAAHLLAAPMAGLGIVDASALPDEVISFARVTALALRFTMPREAAIAPQTMSISESQAELFRLFTQLFVGLTGRAVKDVGHTAQLKDIMLDYLRHAPAEMERNANAAVEELGQFYRAHARDTFSRAKALGGMRLVSGGQRSFSSSSLSAVRITALYADTQLIPDPIYPFLAEDLRLNALHLQLAIALHDVLQLAPLVDAGLPVPPIYLFPSFEKQLEHSDAHTKKGIENLILRVVSPICDGQVSSIEELFDYAKNQSEGFMRAAFANRLFVPSGADPERIWTPDEAFKAYVESVEGIRAAEDVAQLKKLTPSVAVLLNISERLAPQFHLMENANEFGAQPLLSRPVDWHYFERSANASAVELRRKEVLTEQALQTLRAAQDDSLSWLANIPIASLVEVVRNNEHHWFREELNKCTTQLSSVGTANLSEVVREVNHGLASLVQTQQKAMGELEKKYAAAMQEIYIKAGGGLAVAATAFLLPSLSPLLGVAIPAATALAALGAGSIGIATKWNEKRTEVRKAEHSLLGILAVTRPR